MGRLFWKIFFWFLGALLLINLAVIWGVKIYYEQFRESDNKVMETQVQSIALAFENGNFPKVRQFLREIHKQNRTPIFVINDRGHDILTRPLPPRIRRNLQRGSPDNPLIYKIETTLPSGRHFQVVASRAEPWSRGIPNAPVWLGLSIIVVISTLVCYWLAKYLASPVQRLSNATRQLAIGNLNVRVGKTQRRDEIADLSVDFDRMADKIQQLLSSQKQLLQDISHELRSPLARLQVALALIRRDNSDKQTDYDRIAKNLNRLEELIGEVLTLSRLDTVTYALEPINLTELVANIVEDCQLEATAKQCTIITLSNPQLTIEGRPELLRRAIENVLRNAIKFTTPNTEITIELTKNVKQLTFKVNDQGPGIPESSKDSMFEAFVRIDPARQHKPGGYGLGLAIAKKAIELHGGAISAVNRIEGGLSVIINLPV